MRNLINGINRTVFMINVFITLLLAIQMYFGIIFFSTGVVVLLMATRVMWIVLLVWNKVKDIEVYSETRYC